MKSLDDATLRTEAPTFEMGAATPMTVLPVGDGETHAAMRARAVFVRLAICAILLTLAVAVPATAAPSLEVELTRDEATLPVVHRNDERVDYTVKVTNAAVVGATAVGDVLKCDGQPAPVGTRSWFPLSGINSYAYQWLRNGVEIPGETALTHTVAAADAGTAIQCLVTGTNVNATASFVSLPAVVVSPLPAPLPPVPVSATVAGSRPTTTGNLAEPRTCTPPTNWTAGGSPVNYTFQWLRNSAPIPGATASTYIPDSGVGGADVNKVLQCRVIGATTGGAIMGISVNTAVGTVPQPPNNIAENTPLIVDPNTTSGQVTVEVELPPGARIYKLYPTPTDGIFGDTGETLAPAGWACAVSQASSPARATCTRSDELAPGESYPRFSVVAHVGDGVADTAVAEARVSGGGTLEPLSTLLSFDFAAAQGFGITAFETSVRDESDANFTQAGGHPSKVGESFAFTGKLPLDDGGQMKAIPLVPVGSFRSSVTDVPRGFVGSARAPDVLCPGVGHMVAAECPTGSYVGELNLTFGYGTKLLGIPIYAVEPEFGRAAQFGAYVTFIKTPLMFYPRLRADGRYALSFESMPAPLGDPRVLDADVTLCGFGARAKVGADGTPAGTLTDGCKSAGEPDPDGAGPFTGAFERPLVTLPPRCGDAGPTTVFRADAWEAKGEFVSRSFTDPPLTGCELVRFDPQIAFSPTSTEADSASGLDVELSVPSEGLEDPEGVSQAHLRKAVVELPEGVAVNPSAAAGLEGCSDSQLALGTDDEPGCPDGSRIASVEVTTPLLDESLSGAMVLRTPSSTDPASGEMLRMALIVRNDARGLLVKLPGSATADPQTGRLTATFDENPELPIGTVTVKLKGGSRGVLAMPQDCGGKSIDSELSPWKGDANISANAQSFSDGFVVGGDCSNRFAPRLTAGMDTRSARANGKFSFKFTRNDGEQWLRGLTAKLPRGLLASVKDLPLCSDVQAKAGGCPAGSRIGIVDAKAGSGDPFVLEQKGEAFLTEGYKGGEYGLAVKIRPVAGPFRGDMELSPIIVRQAIHVDRKTAQVTAVSDPFPLIHHGVPLRTREVTVVVDRDKFMLNPSSCAAKQVGADILSAEGVSAGVANHFQAVNCATLPFRPKLALRLTGRGQVRTGKHPGVRAVVTQKGVREAGIEKATVRLPKSLALDVDNAQALCEFADGTKPDLENHCPKGSIVGRARAVTPLLNDPLVGNVYFVKNVRKDPTTGNLIRTLPMIVVALRGEIAVNLTGKSSTTKAGKLVNTFNAVPDAPVSRFNLNIAGGKNGILAVTRTRRSLINLCAGRHTAEADMDGHNGRRHDLDVAMKAPCSKRQSRSAKRKSRRLAAQR